MLLGGEEAREAIARAASTLRESDFYKGAHGLIWASILTLFERGVAADIVSAIAELERR